MKNVEEGVASFNMDEKIREHIEKIEKVVKRTDNAFFVKLKPGSFGVLGTSFSQANFGMDFHHDNRDRANVS